MHENGTINLHGGDTDGCPPGLILPLLDERFWSSWFRTSFYFCSLLYFFLGTAIVTQIFMAAIDRITSHTKKVYLANYRSKKNGSSDSLDTILKEDEPEIIEVRVWNDTVANLILMAFGTASPEILLSIVEVVAHHFESGKLGPATIVGSAAFNLLIITSVCMLALPVGETKRVHRLKVFIVTGLFSLFAYIWLLMILRFITPNVVELWEASITFILFPILIIFAYATDRDYFGFLKSRETKRQMELDIMDNDLAKTSQKKNLYREDGQIDKENLIDFIKEAKKFQNLKNEEIAILAATKLVDATNHSSNWYRINSIRSFAGSRRGKPVLDAKLQQIYEILKNHPDGLKLEDIPPQLDPSETDCSVVEFHSPNVSVRENVGQFLVSVCRYGDLQAEVKVKIDSVDGSAKQGEDYLPVREILTFSPYETEKKVPVKIIDDNKWEPDEEFFLRLTVLRKYCSKVKLGQFPIMEVTIIDDDEPGIVKFEKRGLVVKESAGYIKIPVIRVRGSDGDVTVKWKTVDKSAISGRDYIGGEGVLTFKHNEVWQSLEEIHGRQVEQLGSRLDEDVVLVNSNLWAEGDRVSVSIMLNQNTTRQEITIPIIDDLNPEKDEFFEVVLYEPSNGVRIGNINRVLITISNDDDFNSVAHRLMVLTGANLDAMRVHTETWAEQFKQAMSVRGGDIENAHFWDYVLHFFAFFWKVLFAFIPPVAIFGGWLCFFVSLSMIGIMTTIIGDLATIFGCLIELDDTMTAITIVALGTTLPDILGARMVTCNEEHADGALIHISGSIAVNVLIGVGVPWFVAALYHFRKGSHFVVESTGLEWSVLLFLVTVIIATLILAIRRQTAQCGRAELGGPAKTRYLTVGILVTMWLLYLLFIFLQITHVINEF